MKIRFIVQWTRPTHIEAFEEHYRKVHISLANRILHRNWLAPDASDWVYVDTQQRLGSSASASTDMASQRGASEDALPPP
jgi:hypothetical protein